MTNDNNKPGDPQSSDTRLNDAARRFSTQHDERSFTTLYRAAHSSLWDFVASLSVRRHDVDDVVSLTGTSLWTQREDFSGTYANFVAFGIRIARVQARAWIRKECRQFRSMVLVSGDVDDENFEEPDAPDHIPNPEQIAIARETLRALSSVELRVVKARLQGYTFEEIAQDLGVSNQRVYVVYEKALKKLRVQP